MKMFNKRRIDIEGGEDYDVLRSGAPDGFVGIYSAQTDRAMAKMKECLEIAKREKKERGEAKARKEEEIGQSSLSAAASGEDVD
jgi:hypothetical protein